MSPLLCFVHVPKTAGTSVRKALELARGKDRVFWVGDPVAFVTWQALNQADFERFDVIGGHITAFDFRHIRRPKVFAAMVREPIRRAVSFFNFITRDGSDHPLTNEVRGLSIPQALIRSPTFADEVTDRQSVYLAAPNPDPVAALRNREDFILAADDPSPLLAEIADRFGWRVPSPPRSNEAPGPYFARLATPEAVAALKPINEKDEALYRFLKGLG